MKRYIALIIGVVVIGSKGFAEEEIPTKVKLHGYFRMRGIYMRHLSLTSKEDPRNTGYLQTRLRLEPEISPVESVRIYVEIDALDDLIWGAQGVQVPVFAENPNFYGGIYPGDISDTTPQGTSRIIGVKRAWAEIETPFGRLDIGRMPSHWGLGILQNDGRWFRNEYGDAHFGDTKDRILFRMRPFGEDSPFLLAIGYDKVWEADKNGFHPESPADDIDHWLLIPYWKDEERGIKGGIFMEAVVGPKTDTRIAVIDPYVEVSAIENLSLEAEASFIYGETKCFNEIRDLVAPSPKDVDIGAINAVFRGKYRWDPLEFILEVGYASGDKDGLRNRRIESIPMDRDYNVGLLMFERVGALYSKRVYDERIKTTWGKGYEEVLKNMVSTDGAVSNALYIYAAPLRFAPVESFTSTLSVLYGRAIYSPYRDWLRGEDTTNIRGGKLGKNYGWELDWVSKIQFNDSFGFGLQLGWFWPGDALEDQNGNARSVFGMEVHLTAKF